MLTDVTAQTRATSFADGIVRPLAKSLPLVCAGLYTSLVPVCKVGQSKTSYNSSRYLLNNAKVTIKLILLLIINDATGEQMRWAMA